MTFKYQEPPPENQHKLRVPRLTYVPALRIAFIAGQRHDDQRHAFRAFALTDDQAQELAAAGVPQWDADHIETRNHFGHLVRNYPHGIDIKADNGDYYLRDVYTDASTSMSAGDLETVKSVQQLLDMDGKSQARPAATIHVLELVPPAVETRPPERVRKVSFG